MNCRQSAVSVSVILIPTVALTQTTCRAFTPYNKTTLLFKQSVAINKASQVNKLEH